MVTKKTILVVEDDKSLLPMITYNIEKNGFQVKSATNGEDALLLIKEEIPSLAIFDWMIPEPNGLELCKILRRKQETSNLPIIMLTAREEEEDRIRGLEYGADDYISKPFSPAELIPRIKALIRRSTSSQNHILEFEDIKIFDNEHKVFRGKTRVHLGPTEYNLLKHLMEKPCRVFSREQLLDSVWGHGIYVERRTVDTHIRRLRKSLNIEGKKNFIRTIRSSGYSIDKD